MTNINEKEFKKDYLNGMKYKDLMQKYNITDSNISQLRQKLKLTRDKSKAQIGNQNAAGHEGKTPEENKNAVTTGEYETIYKGVLSEEELEMYEKVNFDDERSLLLEDYRILSIRANRMLKRIQTLNNKDKDLTIGSIKKKETRKRASVQTETITEAESTINIIQKIEEALTRVQEAKRKILETLQKLDDGTESTVNLNVISASSVLESINRQLGGGDNE